MTKTWINLVAGTIFQRTNPHPQLGTNPQSWKPAEAGPLSLGANLRNVINTWIYNFNICYLGINHWGILQLEFCCCTLFHIMCATEFHGLYPIVLFQFSVSWKLIHGLSSDENNESQILFSAGLVFWIKKYIKECWHHFHSGRWKSFNFNSEPQLIENALKCLNHILSFSLLQCGLHLTHRPKIVRNLVLTYHGKLTQLTSINPVLRH